MANPNTNLTLTLEAFADIVIDNWLDNITKLRIGHTFNLQNSLSYEILHGADRLPSAIVFSLPLYGKFVDMGVGKGVRLEDVKSSENQRRPRKWYSKTFYSQSLKLSNILARKYGRIGTLAIVEQIEGNKFF